MSGTKSDHSVNIGFLVELKTSDFSKNAVFMCMFRCIPETKMGSTHSKTPCNKITHESFEAYRFIRKRQWHHFGYAVIKQLTNNIFYYFIRSRVNC